VLFAFHFYAPLGLLSVWRRLLERFASAVPKPFVLIDFKRSIVKSITYYFLLLSPGGVLLNFRFNHLVKKISSFLAEGAVLSIYLIV
jgi:hypothetical protein